MLARSAQVVLRAVRDPDADGGEAAAGVEGQAVHPPDGYAVERRARVPAPERPAQPAALTAAEASNHHRPWPSGSMAAVSTPSGAVVAWRR